MKNKRILNKIIARCKEEIEWVDSCLADMESGTKYAEEDNTYLSGWRKAHQQILDIIKGEKYYDD